MSDAGTVAFYDRVAGAFTESTAGGAGDFSSETALPPALARFIAALPEGGAVLDLGCGPGKDLGRMLRAGLSATGLDPSKGLLEVAARFAPGAHLIEGGFDDLDAVDAYDGVWANFSLLHAPRADMPRHLATIARALRPGGLFHLALLLGDGEIRDAHARAYTYYDAAELRALLAEAGFAELEAETGTKNGLDGPEPFIALLLRTET